MNNDPRRMRVPDCVCGIGTRSFRCRNGDISFYYSDGVAVMMTVFDIWFKEWKAQTNLFAVRVGVSPLTQELDIVAAMDPLLDPLGVVCRFDEVIFATRLLDADAYAVHLDGVLRRFSEFVVLITVS